jgi:aminoglycoside/choline kinase family phosphotransferase
MRTLLAFLRETVTPGMAYSGRLRLKPLKGDGSDRRIYRLYCRRGNIVAVVHPKGRPGRPSENDSFAYMARHLKKKKINVPRLFAYHRRRGCFLMEDFGDLDLAAHITGHPDPRRIITIYKPLLEHLLNIQIRGAEGFEPRFCYDTPLFDGLFTWHRESRYFLESFLKGYLGYPVQPKGVEEELRHIAGQVDREKVRGFLYRDFQSRNIMVQGDSFGFIDFQGGRLGPPQYDLASLLIDPYVQLSWEIQEELLEYYLKGLSFQMVFNHRHFIDNYEFIAFQRNLQILGAFAFLSRVKGKTYFEQYIPAALKTLKRRAAGKPFRSFNKVRRLIEGL